MNQAESISLEQAQEEVNRSNLEFESALTRFRDKVEDGVREYNRYSEAIKNPLVMTAVVFTVGIFFGQVLRFSFRNRKI
jgi:hypothetical protein